LQEKKKSRKRVLVATGSARIFHGDIAIVRQMTNLFREKDFGILFASHETIKMIHWKFTNILISEQSRKMAKSKKGGTDYVAK
jgi:hypothetical protein